MASAEAVGSFNAAVLDAACAVEMVHCFSLVHDDLPAIDDDQLRRGQPTCHVKFGEAIAILAGDALFALAFATLANSGGKAEVVSRALAILSEATGELVRGEVLDVLAEGSDSDADMVMRIHQAKTGSLVAASCEIGGVLGGAAQSQLVALRDYGSAVGLAFQITDDLLNEISSPEALGKSAQSDRHRKKATYPALLGIEGASNEAQRACEHALSALASAAIGSPTLNALARFAIDRVH